MPNAPARPASVPAEAVFSEDVESWEIGGRAADGRRRGLCTFYRPDGRLYLRGEFEAGVQHGPFSMFHPDGTVAREGTFARGELDGDLVAYTSENPTTVPLRGCCVPDTARTLRATYREGRLVREAFYDAEDRELSPEGVRIPDRPASVPPDASFDDLSWRWMLRTATSPVSHVDRYLTAEGALSEELEYSGGVKVAQRLFDAQGRLREASGFDAEGRLHGPALKRVPEGEPSPYADARVRAERGEFEHGHPVGLRELLDEGDGVLRTLDFGGPWPADAAWAAALSDDTADAETLWAAAAALRADHRAREALCVAARAAVRAGDSGRLRAFVAESTLQLTPALARERGVALSDASAITFVAALDELLTGAEPPATYRTLSSVVERAPRLAHDLIEAALLLEPDGPLFHFTRGLLRLELGDERGAMADAALLEAEAPEGARFLRDSVRVLFPSEVFWPALQTLPPATEETPELAIEQSLEAVRHQLQVYATRQHHFRAALQKLRGAHAPTGWLPPDCAALLPDGPLPLRHDTVTIVEENENGVEEETQVAFDERIDDRLVETATPLLSAARANWAALTWLCWAAGLDHVALPEHLEPRPDYAAAVAASMQRRYRARDLLTTGGILARSRGVPGFIWEGVDIDSLHRRLASVLADECQEIRAVFLWSMWEQNVSPFQTDLRPD